MSEEERLHEWEDVPLPEREQKTIEFEAPVQDGSGAQLLQHVQLNLDMKFAYVEKVAEAISREPKEDVYGAITSLRRCRVCGQESINGRDPDEPCNLRQVRTIMEE